MSYVGADAQGLAELRSAVAAAGDEVSGSRRRIAGLFAEAGEADVVGPELSAVEVGLSAAGCEVGIAAEIASADAAPTGGQTGWRAQLGIVDDGLLDIFWVNDLSRIFTGSDINTGTRVGIGGRLASAAFLIPITKLAKLTKLTKVAKVAAVSDEAAEVSARVARSTAPAIRDATAVRKVLAALPTADSRDVWKVSSVSELDDLFERLSRGGRPAPIAHGGPSMLLPDGTRISRRAKSKSGGATIDISIVGTDRRFKVHIAP